MRSVGHVHARQGTDHALILKDALQRALADLGLIGGVGRVELGTVDDLVYHAGHVMVVGSGSQETGKVTGIQVLLAHGLQLGHDLHLGQRLRERQLGKAAVLRNVVEQVLYPLDANSGQHLGPIRVRVRNVAHYCPPRQ